MPARCLYSSVVQADWLDALGHVNFLEHQRAADRATDQFWLEVGGEPPTENRALAFVIVETHVRYERELRLGDRICVDTRVIAYDHRRIHLHHSVMRGDETASVAQVLGLAFDAACRRATHWPPSMLHAFGAWRELAQADMPAGLMAWKLSAPQK